MPLFSHYDNIPDISYPLAIPSLVFCVVTPIFVTGRFAGRFYVQGTIGADVWTILSSMILVETISITMIIVCQWGFGKHVKDLDRALVMKTLKVRQSLSLSSICWTADSIHSCISILRFSTKSPLALLNSAFFYCTSASSSNAGSSRPVGSS